MIPVQSISDVITNSSSELFIVSKEDMLHYVDVYDEKLDCCFSVKKLTIEYLKMHPYMSWDVKSCGDTHWHYVLKLLKISEEQAAKEGLKIKKIEDAYGPYWRTYEYDDDIWNDEKKRKEKVKEFFESWCKFCYKHQEEIKEKVLGNYVMDVEDHFERWSDFREEIANKGYLYHESHH